MNNAFRNTRKILLLVFCFLTIFQAFSQDIFEIDKIAFSESRRYEKFQNSTFKSAAQSVNYDLKYHRLNWEVNPSIRYIKGDVTSYFVPLISGFNEIYFDLSSVLVVDSVKYHEALVTFTHLANNTLKIDFPSTIPQNSLDSVTVFYQGVPASTGFGSFEKSTHSSTGIIWTLSEPFGAFEWWPCKESLSDKIDSIDIFVTTPKQNKVGTQGLLVNQSTDGVYNTYHWKHRYPIATYLISIAVTNYAEFTIPVNLSQGTLPVLNYVYPEDSATAYSNLISFNSVIQLYDTLFTPYPFMNEKYGHAQFGWSGGMEHQTMSSMGGFSVSLTAHELAHQWFGDKITCNSWSEIWLNEGFATFCTGMYYKHIEPIWFTPWKLDMINTATSQPGGSVYCTDSTNISSIFSSRLSYKKGAYLLRMLEWKIGTTNFFQGLRNYLNDTNLAYNYSSTNQLKNHLEAVSGLNLTEFFDDWYYGEGYPSYKVNWNQSGTSVNFLVTQEQSHNSVSFFEMPIPIYLKGQGFDTTLVFEHTFSGQNFSANIPFIIDSVLFDPELWILSKNDSIFVGVVESKNMDGVVVYPNPTSNSLNISTEKPVNEIKIYDALGRVVQHEKSNFKLLNFMVDISGLAKGHYILEVEIENEIFRKLISKI